MGEFNLEAAIAAATERAGRAGALVPLESEGCTMPEAGVDFEVRWVSSLRMKDAAIPRAGDKARADFNPFLPYEEALFVANVSPSHVVLLNKFPVTPGHVLIVTRAFAEQQAPLDDADFAAVAALLRQSDGLAFCNGGPEAGASQRHKHLQLTPMQPPIAALLPAQGVDTPRQLSALSFRHAFVSVDDAALAEPARLRALFESACAACGVSVVDGLLSPYNLLLTRRWLMVVPRSRENWEGDGARLSINALGFAGSVFLRQPEQLEAVQRAGVLNILASVT